MSKKLIIILVILIFPLLLLTGCGSKDTPINPGDEIPLTEEGIKYSPGEGKAPCYITWKRYSEPNLDSGIKVYTKTATECSCANSELLKLIELSPKDILDCLTIYNKEYNIQTGEYE